MADHPAREASAADAPHGAAAHQIHLPPNSWAPISMALGMSMTFIGLLAATWVWVVGLAWFLTSLGAWVRGARNEYRELPDSGGH